MKRVAGPKGTFSRVLTGSSLVALTLGLLSVPLPFGGDQSLFAVFAQMIGDGARLYEDIWDVKQPGIFWFFVAAGSWNQFSEVGIHLIEVIWWTGGSAILAFELRRHMSRAWVAGLLPVFAAGIYFAVSTTGALTQVESLMSIPLAAVALSLARAVDGRRTRASSFAAGLLCGLMAIFKLLLAVIPVTMLVVAALAVRRSESANIRPVREIVMPFALGLLIPLTGLSIWVSANGLWEVLWETWIVYPPQVLRVNPRPLGRLLGSSLGFAIAFAPLCVLSIFRLTTRVARGRTLTYILLASVASGVLVVVLQLWWGYLFYVLVAPLALLAIQGLDDAVASPRRSVAALVGLVAVVALFPAASRTVEKATGAFGLVSGDTLAEYQDSFPNRLAADAAAEVVVILPNERLYVLGDPTIMYVTDSQQAIPINGWSPEFWTDEIWRRMAGQLEARRPSKVYVADWADSLIAERAPWFAGTLEGIYHDEVAADSGRWLVSP